jgi:hypothetical protein
MLPQSVMESPALASAQHAAFRVLAILLVGKAKERNGLLMCSDSYGAEFGLKSHGTVQTSLRTLEERGLIFKTQRVQKLKRFAALYAVTWLPNYYRNGQPLPAAEPPTHAYKQFTPIIRVKKRRIEDPSAESRLPASPRLSGDHTPIIGVKSRIHHPDLPSKTPDPRPDNRVNSKNLPGSASAAAATLASAASPAPDPRRADRVKKMLLANPDWSNTEIARVMQTEESQVAEIRSRI